MNRDVARKEDPGVLRLLAELAECGLVELPALSEIREAIDEERRSIETPGASVRVTRTRTRRVYYFE